MSNMTIDPNAHMPIGNTQTAAQLAGGSNDGKVKDKTTTLTREITSLAQRAITVLTTNRAQTQQTTGASGTTGGPVLDDPEDPKALLQDLERLVAFLQMDNDQRQSEMARARIENQQGVMDKEHQTRLDKIDESIKAAKKAEKAAKASRILGWLGAIFAVIAAVVVTAVTGGAAAGFAIAGAALAVTQLVLSETGAADKIIDKMAESMQENFGMSKADSKAWAAGIYSAIFVVLGLGVQTSLNYKASEASAEVSDVNRYMAVIQQLLEESEEELEQIMNQIQALFSQLVAIIQSKTDTGNMIVENMTQMI